METGNASLEYINYLVNIEDNQSKAAEIYEKTLKSLTLFSKERFVQEYNAIIGRK